MSSTYGYCRISRKQQSIDRQIRNIKAEYPKAIIVQEAYTGTTINRKEWQKLFSSVKANDTIVFDSVSRMSRNADEGIEAYDALYRRGVRLVFLKEQHINTDVYKKALENSVAMTGGLVDEIIKGINNYLMALAKEQIRIAFDQSEKEVQDLRQRTREGLVTARMNGASIGRKPGKKITTKKSIIAKETIRKHAKEFGGQLSDIEVMQLTQLARNTYYKYKAEIRTEG